jgi:phage terminase large subunit
VQIPVNFKPRWYQAAALRALESGVQMNVWCWARRGGKDYTAFAYAVRKMIETPMNVVLVFPKKDQGKKAFWDNVENDGFKTVDHIPQSLRKSTNNDDMIIRLKNGSTFQVMGAGDPDALRGANGKLYIFSEFVDIPKAAIDVIRPIIRNNGGQIIVQSTPKIDGISGATFKVMFDRAMKHPKQFASLITAEEYLSAEELEDIRQEVIEENGNDFWYRQEYLCDFGQASSASYYGQALKLLRDRKGIAYFPYNNKYPVYTVWDWGLSDNTAIGFFQYYLINGKPTVRIIDSYETHDIGIKGLVNFVTGKPYTYGWHFFPHDTAVRDSDLIERIEKFREEGLLNSSILKRENRDDGIERVASNLPNVQMNETTTVILRRKLAQYKRKFNPLTGDYVGAQHDSASHYADMIRYLFAALEQEFNKETCQLLSEQDSMNAEYETEELSTSNYYQPELM